MIIIYIYIVQLDYSNIIIYFICKVNWATRRLPFQKLLHRSVGEGAAPFPGLLHFTLNIYVPYKADC